MYDTGAGHKSTGGIGEVDAGLVLDAGMFPFHPELDSETLPAFAPN